MDLELKGRKVLISGASRGLGRTCAEAFLKEGAQVAIFARDPGPLEETIAALSPAGKIIGKPCDAGDFGAVTDWTNWAIDTLGGVDIVVSNASALGGIPRSKEGWDINYNVDMLSAVALFDAALEGLIASDAAAFVQMATITASEYHGFPGGGLSYGAIKASLVNYVAQLGQEYMADGIRANCVSPGPIYLKGGSWDWIEENFPDYFTKNQDQHPAKRFGKPEEVADAVTFLASNRASWITGQNITVDGGFTKRVGY